jgi:hypothetical protein
MKVPYAVETNTMVLVNDDNKKNKMMAKNHHHHHSSLSVASSLAEDDEVTDTPHCCDDECLSSSASVLHQSESCSLLDTECSESILSVSTSTSEFGFGKSSSLLLIKDTEEILSSSSSSLKTAKIPSSFTILRLKYLLVILVIMLADGLQGAYSYNYNNHFFHFTSESSHRLLLTKIRFSWSCPPFSSAMI